MEHPEHELAILITKALDGTLTEQEFRELESRIVADHHARRYYKDYLTTYMTLYDFECSLYLEGRNTGEQGTTRKLPQFSAILEELGLFTPSERDQETTSDAESTPVPVERPSLPRFGHAEFFRGLTRVAAIIAIAFSIVLLDRRIWRPQQMPQVARMSTALEAAWDSPIHAADPYFLQGQTHILKQGCATLDFFSGASVVIEGPSEFVCLSPEKLFLVTGRAYASVPQRAVGFVIETENSRIVDLGTEFGVRVDSTGTTELHVFKGLTSVVTNGSRADSRKQNVAAGQARKISADSGEVQTIDLAPGAFARRLYPDSHMIWRGQPISLADLITGGNGFGSGAPERMIDPVSGRWLDKSAAQTRRTDVPGPDRLVKVASSYINCIFTPREGDVTISTQGHQFYNCPATNGKFNHYIMNGTLGWPIEFTLPNGRPFVDDQVDSVYLHANLGITFDLDALRRSNSTVDIVGFRTLLAVAQVAKSRTKQATFHLLLDGDLVHQSTLRSGQSEQVEFVIAPSHRFLTLITTENDDGISNDRTFFMEPELILDSATDTVQVDMTFNQNESL